MKEANFIKTPFIYAGSGLSLLIINLMWGEKRDFEINKPEKGQKCSFTASGLLINHCTPEMIQFEFRVELFGRI